jgi:DNA-binding transcriptional regulator YiaG
VSYQTKATGWTTTPGRRRGARTAFAVYAAMAAGRREDYFWLRDEQGLTVSAAAARMRVTPRTAHRWESLRESAEAAE